MARRSQPYRLHWPMTASQLENIDEMFQLLFDDTDNGTMRVRPNQLTGVVPVNRGGTGLDSYTIGDILYASAATTLSTLADVATGYALISGGVATAPSWGKIGLTTHVDGVLPVANGGTNISSYTIGDLLYASGATTLSKLADVAAGSYLRSGGVATAPVWSTTTLPNTVAQGDLLYGSATNVVSTLAKNTSSTRYLSNTGTSNAPAWAQVDLSTGVTGSLSMSSLGTLAGLSVLGTATSTTVSRVSGSHAQVQYAQSASARTLAYGGALTVGSLLVVIVTTTATTTGNTCSDSVNGAYTLAGSYQSGIRRIEIFYYKNNTSSATPTVTVTPSESSYLSFTLDEYLGMEQIATVVRSASSGNTGTDSTIETGNVTATAADLIVGAGLEYAGTQTVSSVSADWTLDANLPRVAGTSTAIFTAYNLAATGTQQNVFTLTGAGDWLGLAVAFVKASGVVPAAVTAGTDHQVLRRSGSTLAFGAVNLAQSAAITGNLPIANLGNGTFTKVTSSVTGTNNDLNIGVVGDTYCEWSGASDATITGITLGASGKLLIIKNTGSKVAYFPDNSGSSSAANRFQNYVTSGSTPIAAGGWIAYLHNGTDWQLVGHEQGAYITPTFASGDFTLNGDRTWTVDSGDVTNYRWKLSGTTLHVTWVLQTTTLSGGTSSTVGQIAIPNSFTATVQTLALSSYFIFTGAFLQYAGYASVATSGTVIQVAKTDQTDLGTGTNDMYFYGQIQFQVN